MLRHSPVVVSSLPDYGVFYLRSVHSERFKMNMQQWPFRKIGYIESGSGKLEFENQELFYKAGDLFFVEANLAHRFVDDQGAPCTLSMACYDDTLLSTYLNIHEQMMNSLPDNKLISISDPWQQNNLTEHFSRMLIEQSQKLPGYEDLLRTSIIDLAVITMRLARQSDPHASNQENMIKGLIDYLKKHFNKEVSIDELADICNVSSRTLTRHFKEVTGKTIIEYLTELRINYACQRIKETRQISFSAIDSGFNDISFFYRVFKKHMGMTPRQYLLKEG